MSLSSYAVLRSSRSDSWDGNPAGQICGRGSRHAQYVARAVVLAGIGIAALGAAVTYDAAKAKGVDGALRSFAQLPFGPWLLILVALGLIAFGILSFLEAPWRRPFGGVPV